MLIRVTSECSQGCKHCLVDAKKKGIHMTMKTFQDTIDLANRIGTKMILISGGEPTEAPLYHDYMEWAIKHYNGTIAVATHGMFISNLDELNDKIGRYKKYPILFQVVNDKRYYPKQIDKTAARRAMLKYPRLKVMWRLGGQGDGLYPQGRAVKMLGSSPENTESIGSKCFNLRSIVHSGQTFYQAVRTLEGFAKFCTPSINPDGTISMGESSECERVANIYTSNEEITEIIKASQCNLCGMVSTTSPMHQIAIRFLG